MNMASGATLMGRKVAEGLMESTCVIVRNGAVTTNPLGVDGPAQTTIYTGKCRLRFPDARSSDVAAAGQALAVQDPILSLPVAATGSSSVQVGDIATVTSPLDSTPVVVRISGLHTQTHSTARRFPVTIQS